MSNVPIEGKGFDPILLEVLWNRLISIAEEQARTLIRVAFSTILRETEDLSCGIFDPQGNMIVQAVTGTPGHVNSMATGVRHFLSKFPLFDDPLTGHDIFPIHIDPAKATKADPARSHKPEAMIYLFVNAGQEAKDIHPLFPLQFVCLKKRSGILVRIKTLYPGLNFFTPAHRLPPPGQAW